MKHFLIYHINVCDQAPFSVIEQETNCFTPILVDCAFHEATLNNIMIRTRTCWNDITPHELIISFQPYRTHTIAAHRVVGVYLQAYGNPGLEGA